MQGLLLKDWYTLVKQMKIMLLILVVFACMPGYSLAAFAVFYAAMLPVTALAYDERSKWDELAIMMPFSMQNVVLSKYILGIVFVAAATVISTVAQLVIGAVQGTGFDASAIIVLVFIACLSLILLCINLPLMFRLGVEKGRIAFIIMICGGVTGGIALKDSLFMALDSLENVTFPVLGVLLLTAVIFFVSVTVSVSMYKKKKG